MCIKAGKNELDSVKALMTMSLNSIIADVFDRELDELSLDLNLRVDLGMNTAQQTELASVIAEYFDQLQIDFSKVVTLDDLFNIVVESEFEHVPCEAF
ncbi:MAG: phosphopantetheine-binding protein [Gammaproteobacteria bacterium]|nr:phosphopantetheine-binding protein [Gammaproteobacteria bacterium]